MCFFFFRKILFRHWYPGFIDTFDIDTGFWNTSFHRSMLIDVVCYRKRFDSLSKIFRTERNVSEVSFLEGMCGCFATKKRFKKPTLEVLQEIVSSFAGFQIGFHATLLGINNQENARICLCESKICKYNYDSSKRYLLGRQSCYRPMLRCGHRPNGAPATLFNFNFKWDNISKCIAKIWIYVNLVVNCFQSQIIFLLKSISNGTQASEDRSSAGIVPAHLRYL